MTHFRCPSSSISHLISLHPPPFHPTLADKASSPLSTSHTLALPPMSSTPQPTLTPQQARLAAANRLKARDKFAAQSSSAAAAGPSSGPGTANANARIDGRGNAGGGNANANATAGSSSSSLVNRAQAGPANSRNAVEGQAVDAPLRRDPGLVSEEILKYL